MCWKSNEKKASQIAGEDILVYKIMLRNPDSKMFWSLYYKMGYELGKVYTTCIDDPLYAKNIMTIRKGFYSYDDKKTEISEGPNSWHINPKDNKYGFLDIVVCPSDFLDNEYKELVAVECIIPKGACYYENELGEIVSDRIMVTSNIIKKFHY